MRSGRLAVIGLPACPDYLMHIALCTYVDSPRLAQPRRSKHSSNTPGYLQGVTLSMKRPASNYSIAATFYPLLLSFTPSRSRWLNLLVKRSMLLLALDTRGYMHSAYRAMLGTLGDSALPVFAWLSYRLRSSSFLVSASVVPRGPTQSFL